MNRSAMPQPGQPILNSDLANEFSMNPTFQSVAQEVEHERELQAVRYLYVYPLSGEVVGQTSQVFSIPIEQGTDFKCKWIMGSMFSYDAGAATTFPIPNSAGATAWAGRGLSAKITDARSGRDITSGYVSLELLLSPGYGLNFQSPTPFPYFFQRNSLVRFDIRNRDAATRTHAFEIALVGYKIETPA